jgi:carbon storage regulator
MLIITRRPGERLILGEDIKIEVMEVAGNTVRIGIDAPRELPVYREELWAAVKQENEAAAKTAAADLREPSQSSPEPQAGY